MTFVCQSFHAQSFIYTLAIVLDDNHVLLWLIMLKFHTPPSVAIK